MRGWKINGPYKGVWVYASTFFLLQSTVLFTAMSSFAGDITGRVIDPDGTGIAQAVVFAPELPAGAAPQPSARSAVVDQINKAFAPELLPIVVGTEVRFPNHDQIHHHVYSFSRTKNFELPLYKGEDAPPVVFDKVGVVKIGCNIHDWMSGVILVLPTPYYAVTDESGRFILPNLPTGTYPLASWHVLSQSKPEETVQQVRVTENSAEATFTLVLTTARSRSAIRGARGIE